MNQVTQNIRFLLWKSETAREKWSETLANWAACSLSRADELLRGAYLKPEEAANIAQRQQLGGNRQEGTERLQQHPLLHEANVNILQENLGYLLGDLRRGEKGDLARSLGIETETLRRWREGINTPHKSNLDTLCRHFGLRHGVNLEEDAIFLSLTPVSEKRKKQWLCRQIQNLDLATLNELFPALERMLKA